MRSSSAKGKFAEQKAVSFLKDSKYKIIHTNWKCRLGEIDIIARESSYLCFIEVKYRSTDLFGSPGEAVGQVKKNKIIRLAQAFINNKSCFDENIRFDVVEVYNDRINLIKNAFEVDV